MGNVDLLYQSSHESTGTVGSDPPAFRNLVSIAQNVVNNLDNCGEFSWTERGFAGGLGSYLYSASCLLRKVMCHVDWWIWVISMCGVGRRNGECHVGRSEATTAMRTCLNPCERNELNCKEWNWKEWIEVIMKSSRQVSAKPCNSFHSTSLSIRWSERQIVVSPWNSKTQRPTPSLFLL